MQVDAFLQLLYPEDPKEWMTWILTRGKTAELVEGNIQLGKPSYLSEEVRAGASRLFSASNADNHISISCRNTRRSAKTSCPTGSSRR